MSFKDDRGCNRGTRCKTVPKNTRGTNDQIPRGMVEVGERPSTRSNAPSLFRKPLKPLAPRTFPTFRIMGPRAGARPRVLAVISRLFGFITVVAIIEKFSRSPRRHPPAPDCLSSFLLRAASGFTVKLLT